MISFSLQGDSNAFGILLTEDEIFFERVGQVTRIFDIQREILI